MSVPKRTAVLNLARAASLAFAVLVAWSVRPGEWVAGSFLVALVALGAVRAGLEDARLPAEGASTDKGPRRSITVLVRVGDEPDEMVLSTAVMGERLGPVILFVSPDRAAAPFAARGLDVQRIGMGQAGLRHLVTTEAVFVVSPGALPDAGAVAAASGLLSGDVGWVTGASVPVSRPGWRGLNPLVAARQRSRIRAVGGVLWEPNATLVRRDLLPEVTPERSGVLGDWLRDGSRRGLRGVSAASTFSRQLLLADGKHFWPREIQQHKGAAADLHRALKAGPARARRAEVVGLGQTLSAWPLLAWLLVPLVVVASGGFPLRLPAWEFWVSAVAVGALRSWAIRTGLGLPSGILDEVRARFAGTPGSLSAITAVVTGRLRPRRREAPSQPLLLIAAIISLATTVAFVGTRPSPNGMVTPLAIGLVQLILLWRLAAQSITQGLWSRRTYRIRPSCEVRLDGQATPILDASLSGLGVVTDREDIGIGATPAVSVTFSDGTSVDGRGLVVRTQSRPGGNVLGISLDVTHEQHTSWMTHLLQDPAMTDPDGARESADPYQKKSWRTRFDRLGHAAIILAGSVALFAVGVLGFGYRPLTIVSPSMRPTLSIGDVVIEQRTSIASVHVGEIVTVPSSVTGGPSLTHRVRSLVVYGKSVRLETRGDANQTSELFVVPRTTMVGKVVLQVPAVGHVLTKLSSEPVRWSAYGLAALLVVIVGLRKIVVAPSGQAYRRRPKYSL